MSTEVRVDRRVRRTLEAINQAFLALLAEKKFERITINDIAKRANINRGTVYFYYLDKYDLLDKCIQEHLNQMIFPCLYVKSSQISMADPASAVASLTSFFQFIQEKTFFFTSILSSPKSSLFQECLLRIISETLEKQIKMQGVDQGVDQKILTHFVATAFVGTVKSWICNEMPHSPQYMAEQVWELFKRNRIYYKEEGKPNANRVAT